ncbi:MAG: hypothetical protein GEU71_05165 [Actinobacteria bacterium]|nr:hypothetical protein [Actinomycetota bacterium]
MSEQHSPGTDPMVGEVRFKVPLPILIPLAALVVIALVTIGMSRVLLAIPPEAATTVAIAASANVLIAAAILAHRKRMGSTSLIEMGVIVLYPIVIGIVIALLGIGGGEEHAGADEAPPAQAGPVAAGGTLSAETLQFSSGAIELVAGEESELTLDNADSAPHNVWIYETAQDADDLNDDATLFQGEDVGPGESATYTISALDKGEFPFLCRIHPAMRGVVTVE